VAAFGNLEAVVLREQGVLLIAAGLLERFGVLLVMTSEMRLKNSSGKT
jgi:hypothetical protein